MVDALKEKAKFVGRFSNWLFGQPAVVVLLFAILWAGYSFGRYALDVAIPGQIRMITDENRAQAERFSREVEATRKAAQANVDRICESFDRDQERDQHLLDRAFGKRGIGAPAPRFGAFGGLNDVEICK